MGYWGAEIVNLPNGTTVELDVCDLATGLQRRAAAEEAASVCSEVTKSYGGLIAGLVILMIALGASLAWIVYRQKQKEKVMGHLGRFGFDQGGGASTGSELMDKPSNDYGNHFDDGTAPPTNPMEEDLLADQL